MACGDPNLTSRTVHVANKEEIFYPCLPGGDPAKGHLMTSVDTKGYNIAWFSPKATFHNVRRVCWDQNHTDLGGGKWTTVTFVPLADVARVGGDLGFVGPGFTDPNGPSTSSFPSNGMSGLKVFRGGVEFWRDVGAVVTGSTSVGTTGDKAQRYQMCVTDNENGTVLLQVSGPAGNRVVTVPGFIPNGDIRVSFEDDSYDPDKHFDADGVPPASSGLYSWHWDRILIETA